MKNTITAITATAAAVALSTGLQAGEVYTPPIAPPVSESSCPWEISLSALYLKAHSNEDNYDNQDNEFGYRLEVAYQNGGLGYRVRYFDWEGSGSDNAEITSFDIEVFDGFQLGNWDGEYAVGIRYTEFDEGDGTDFDGWGPTLGVEMTRALSGPFSLYAGARGSLIYGDADYNYGDSDYNYDDSVLPIVELELGLQYDINDCTYVRLGIEAQNYQSISNNDNEDTGLFGGALEVAFGW